MSKNSSVSSTNSYSQALYELSKEENCLENIEKEISNILKLLSVSKDFKNLIKDPRAKSSIRGSSARIATGDKVTVRSTGGKGSSTKARKQTATWF